MSSAVMIPAGMTFLAVFMIVMVASDIGIEKQFAGKQGIYCFIAEAGDAAVKPDTCIGKSYLCTAADPAADQSIDTQIGKHPSQCTVTASVGIPYFGRNDSSVFCCVDLELFGMAEVLKDSSVFISYCNFHGSMTPYISFLIFDFLH